LQYELLTNDDFENSALGTHLKMTFKKKKISLKHYFIEERITHFNSEIWAFLSTVSQLLY